jgi:protein-tyrosine phosphatase
MVWSPAQQQRFDKYGVPRSVDVHCHCLPGLDDGPDSMEDSLELCRALVADGITNVVATPHQLGRYDRRNSAELIRETAADLRAELESAGIPLEIVTGGDVRVDDRLLQLIKDGVVETVAGLGRHLLLELPHELFIDPLPLIEQLTRRDVQVIMTHPERHRYLQGSTRMPRVWVEAGASLQVTAGSLLGDFGPHAYDHAWRLVNAGLVDVVASDAHNAHRRPPRMTAALEVLHEALGERLAREMVLENPLKIWEGDWI